MNETQIIRLQMWLHGVRELAPRTIDSRIANCERVERFEGDLDGHFDADGLQHLMGPLTYSSDDARYGRVPRHKMSIDDDFRNGRATLKSAVNLYHPLRISIPDAGATPAPSGGSRERSCEPEAPAPRVFGIALHEKGASSWKKLFDRFRRLHRADPGISRISRDGQWNPQTDRPCLSGQGQGGARQ